MREALPVGAGCDQAACFAYPSWPLLRQEFWGPRDEVVNESNQVWADDEHKATRGVAADLAGSRAMKRNLDGSAR